ncbi:hypothetical protein ACER0C_001660 [Sarotherodon galilaeus]
MLDPADIYFSDFFEFKIRVTQLHGLWIISCAGKQAEEKEAIRAQLTRIATANPGFMDCLPADLKNFATATISSASPSSPEQQLPSVQAESPQPWGDAALPSPASGVQVGLFSLSPVSMPVSPLQQTNAAFFSPQPVAASSATFISAVAAPASTTTASRRRRRPSRHHGSQQHEVHGHVYEMTKTDKLPPKSSTEHLIPLHTYLASLCIDHATTHASKKSSFKTVFTGDASREAQLSPCGTESQARFDPEAELEDSVCSGPPEEPVAASMGVTGQFVQPLPVSAGGSGEPLQHSAAPTPPSVPAECSGETALPSAVAMPPPATPQPEVSASPGPATPQPEVSASPGPVTPAGGSAEPIQHSATSAAAPPPGPPPATSTPSSAAPPADPSPAAATPGPASPAEPEVVATPGPASPAEPEVVATPGPASPAEPHPPLPTSAAKPRPRPARLFLGPVKTACPWGPTKPPEESCLRHRPPAKPPEGLHAGPRRRHRPPAKPPPSTASQAAAIDRQPSRATGLVHVAASRLPSHPSVVSYARLTTATFHVAGPLICSVAISGTVAGHLNSTVMNSCAVGLRVAPLNFSTTDCCALDHQIGHLNGFAMNYFSAEIMVALLKQGLGLLCPYVWTECFRFFVLFFFVVLALRPRPRRPPWVGCFGFVSCLFVFSFFVV